jgi:Lrp/AsnC family leucine-responsive transcriptional regulator
LLRWKQEEIITGYTISVAITNIKRGAVRVVLITFRISQHLPSRLEGLKKYLADVCPVFGQDKRRI